MTNFTAHTEAEMARTQKNKATMGHLCALKARLASLKRTVVEQQTKKSTGPGDGFDVRATGTLQHTAKKHNTLQHENYLPVWRWI